MRVTRRLYRLHRGDFQPTLEDALVAEVAAARSSDPLAPIDVVVPSNLLKLHLRRLLATRSPSRAHLNVRFTTPLELARAIAAESFATEGVAELPPLGMNVLAHAVARGVAAGSTFFEGRGSRGLPRALAAALRDTRDAGLVAADLAGRFANEPRIRDFAALLADFEARLARARLADDAATFTRAAEILEKAAQPAGATAPIVYGFYDFTGTQRRLLRALLQHGGVVMTPIGDGPEFEFAKPARALWQELGFPWPDVAPRTSATSSTALDALRARLFLPVGGPLNGKRVEADSSVAILSCPGRPREAIEAVRVVRDLVDAGVPLHEIAVLSRARAALDPIDERFRAFVAESGAGPNAGPPLSFLHGGRAASTSRGAKSLLLLFDALASGLERERVFEWLHHLGGVGADEDPGQLERLARAARAGAPRQSGRSGDSGEPRGAGARWSAALSRLRARFAAALDAARAEVAAGIAPDEDRADPREESARLERDLAGLARLDAIVAELGAQSDALAGARSFAAFVAVAHAAVERWLSRDEAADDLHSRIDALAALDLVAGDARPDVSLFSDVLLAALDERGRDEGRFGRGLFLGTVLAARGVPFRATILVGLEDGAFPRTTTQSAVLADAERRKISSPRAPLPLAASAVEEDRLLFRLAVGSARERLVITFPRVETAKHREILPSAFVVAVAEALTGARVKSAALDASAAPGLEVIKIAEHAATRAPLDVAEFDRRAIADAVRRGDSGLVHHLIAVHPPAREAVRAELARFATTRFTAWDGMIGGDDASRVAGIFSPSSLESWAWCPFTYFTRYVLGLRVEEDEDRFVLSHRARGSAIHRVLERFYTRVAPTEVFPLVPARRDALLAVLREATERVLATTPEFLELDPPLIALAERARIDEDLRCFLDAEIEAASPSVPRHLESRFEKLALDAGARTIRANGVVDRVDVDPASGALTVIDYKTGKFKDAKTRPLGLAGGRRLQLPIYVRAARERLGAAGHSGRVDSAHLFYCTADGEGVRHALEPELLRPDDDALSTALGVITDGIRGGVFFANPAEAEKRCGFCDYRLACGKGAGLETTFDRKKDDPDAAGWFALRPESAEDDA